MYEYIYPYKVRCVMLYDKYAAVFFVRDKKLATFIILLSINIRNLLSSGFYVFLLDFSRSFSGRADARKRAL